VAGAKARPPSGSVVQPGTCFPFQTGVMVYTLVRFLGLFVIRVPAVVVPFQTNHTTPTAKMLKTNQFKLLSDSPSSSNRRAGFNWTRHG